jgi:hypothetical protein
MIQREISIYERYGDKWIKSIEIHITVDQLSKLFEAFDDDPNYYRPYAIDQSHYKLLVELVPELEKFKLDQVDIFLETFQI